MSRVMSAADRLSLHFDQDWKQTRSTLRERVKKSTYNPLFSWEGRSDNPHSFAKLEVTNYPTTLTKPLCTSGSAVIELERNEDVSIFNGFHKAETLTQCLPRTKEQRALAMKEDLSAEMPLRSEAVATAASVLAANTVRFQNMRVMSPRYELRRLPARLEGAVEADGAVLMHPQHRRSLLEFETMRRHADRDMKTAVKQRMRTKAQVEGQPFYRGILSVDSSSNLESAVYGERARASYERQQRQEQRQARRRSDLASSTSSILTNGNLLDPRSMPETVGVAPDYQHKKTVPGTLTFAETHTRLFERHQGTDWHSMPRNVDRAQRLRDQDLSGKQYNIVTHVGVQVAPSRPMEREHKRWLDHPSQASLESQRNTQGALHLK